MNVSGAVNPISNSIKIKTSAIGWLAILKKFQKKIISIRRERIAKEAEKNYENKKNLHYKVFKNKSFGPHRFEPNDGMIWLQPGIESVLNHQFEAQLSCHRLRIL